MPRSLPLALALMAYGVYIIVPTPDELVIHPVVGYLFARTFDVSIQTGVLWSLGFYNCLGLVLLAVSLALGGRVVLEGLTGAVAQQGNMLRLLIGGVLPGARLDAKVNRSESVCVLAGSSLELFD
jgi:hypothetical protein